MALITRDRRIPRDVDPAVAATFSVGIVRRASKASWVPAGARPRRRP